MDPGAILFPKIVYKFMKTCTCSNPKNHDFAWKVLQKMRVRDLPKTFEMCSNTVLKNIWFLYSCWDASGIGLGTQKASENQ